MFYHCLELDASYYKDLLRRKEHLQLKLCSGSKISAPLAAALARQGFHCIVCAISVKWGEILLYSTNTHKIFRMNYIFLSRLELPLRSGDQKYRIYGPK